MRALILPSFAAQDDKAMMFNIRSSEEEEEADITRSSRRIIIA